MTADPRPLLEALLETLAGHRHIFNSEEWVPFGAIECAFADARALERAGAQVLRLDVFDLLVLYRGRLFMLDAKMPTGRPTKAQAAITTLGWPLRYVQDEIAALQAIGALR